MNYSDELNSLSRNISSKKSQTCAGTETPSCAISENDIINISAFITDVMTTCPESGISRNDVRNGKVLSKGSFGYGFLAGNKIIKIIVCNSNMREENKEELKDEIEVQKKLTLTNHPAFTKLLGYYVREGDQYSFYNSQSEFKIRRSNCDVKINNNGCEIYLIIEAGLHDLTHYFNYNNNKKICELNNPITSNISMLNSFDRLLTYYKTSYDNKYIYNNKIFIHSDIKLENIIFLSNKELKFIDFGLSEFHDKFFKRSGNGTLYFFKLLFRVEIGNTKFFDANLLMISPLYDIFCILISIFELLSCERFIHEYDSNGQISVYKNFNYVNHKIVKLLNDISNRNILNKLISHYYLLCSIYNFHNQLVTQYLNIKQQIDSDDLRTDSTTLKYLAGISEYTKLYDMQNFTIYPLENTTKELPRYINTNNKNEDDIKYLASIMDYYYY